MRPDIDKGGRTPIKRADIVDGKKIRLDTTQSDEKLGCYNTYL